MNEAEVERVARLILESIFAYWRERTDKAPPSLAPGGWERVSEGQRACYRQVARAVLADAILARASENAEPHEHHELARFADDGGPHHEVHG